MKFQHSAFIRRNTPELRKKLEELGWIRSLCTKTSESLSCFETLDLHPQTGTYRIMTTPTGCTPPWDAIDCGTNESLFLAIAAIREDSDYMQWFVDFKGRMFLCEYPYVMLCIEIPDHKASPKELEEHFNQGE